MDDYRDIHDLFLLVIPVSIGNGRHTLVDRVVVQIMWNHTGVHNGYTLKELAQKSTLSEAVLKPSLIRLAGIHCVQGSTRVYGSPGNFVNWLLCVLCDIQPRFNKTQPVEDDHYYCHDCSKSYAESDLINLFAPGSTSINCSTCNQELDYVSCRDVSMVSQVSVTFDTLFARAWECVHRREVLTPECATERQQSKTNEGEEETRSPTGVQINFVEDSSAVDQSARQLPPSPIPELTSEALDLYNELFAIDAAGAEEYNNLVERDREGAPSATPWSEGCSGQDTSSSL